MIFFQQNLNLFQTDLDLFQIAKESVFLHLDSTKENQADSVPIKNSVPQLLKVFLKRTSNLENNLDFQDNSNFEKNYT